MVRILRSLVQLCLLTLPLQALATSALLVEVDRTQLHEDETLVATVTGQTALNLSFDMLFNLRDLDLPEPSLERLQENFEILSRNQRYSVSTVNNQTQATITWTYHLSPRRTGELELPPLTFQGSESKPLTITVLPGRAPAAAGQPRDAFVEIELDKISAYVQEQVLLTVRLFYHGNLIRGELSQPEHPHAIIDNLGRQQEYQRHRDGIRYRVVERRYAVFPQRAGELLIDDIRFEGRARIDGGQLKFLRDSAPFPIIQVSPPPASFSGDTWLPASSLSLSETWSNAIDQLQVGQSVTRQLILQAEGLHGSALPDVMAAYPNALRAYPDAPSRSSESQTAGITGSLTQSTALIVVEPGTVTLPEVRIPWWDVNEDRERLAIIPAQTLTIGGTVSRATPPIVLDPERPTTSQGAPLMDGSRFWMWASAALAGLWLLTLALWLINRRHPLAAVAPDAYPQAEKDLFNALCERARTGHPETLELLPRWANTLAQGTQFHSAAEVVGWSQHHGLREALNGLQTYLYAPADQAPGNWQSGHLLAALKDLRQAMTARQKKHRRDALPPLRE
ncbi:MAG: BatD family protein [Marinobacter sp.]|nr:BatD family protein [Marinobacter sp.]